MKMSRLPLFALVAYLSLFSSAALADAVSFSGTAPIILDQTTAEQSSTPAYYNTVTLSNISGAVSAGDQFLQPITFNSGYDAIGGPQPFSFSENISVNGTNGSYLFTGEFDVSPTTDPDTIIFYAGLPTDIGAFTFTLEGLAFLDNPPYPGGVASKNLTFEVAAATPEPASLALLGTGMLGAVGFMRRRIFS